MTAVDTVTKTQLKELLVRCWTTHDAMWFAGALKEFGIDAANRLNRSAIRGLAPIEVRRILRALRMDQVENLDELRAFIDGARELVVGDFLDDVWHWEADGTVRVEVRKCFAYEGISKLGAIECYECGIFERVCAWLDALGVSYEIIPAPRRCLMHREGRCIHQLRFEFPAVVCQSETGGRKPPAR